MARLRIAVAAALAVVSAAGALAACGDDGPSVEGAAAEPITRIELADGAPANAPGQHLYLQEVVVEPGRRLATHYHEGTQIAAIRSGTLTYHMISGTVEITRLDGTVDSVTGPAVTEIHAGESVVEPSDAVHYGANDGDEAVVIVLAALIADGAPLATPVDD